MKGLFDEKLADGRINVVPVLINSNNFLDESAQVRRNVFDAQIVFTNQQHIWLEILHQIEISLDITAVQKLVVLYECLGQAEQMTFVTDIAF